MSFAKWLRLLQARLQSQKRAPRRRINHLSGLHDWVLEDRCLLSGGVPAPTPSGGWVALSKIMWNGGPPLNPPSDKPGGGNPNVTQAPPMKSVTFQNTTDHTIYPFLRDANSGVGAGGYYDPQDLHNQEFRLYVGYVQSGTDYLGLLPHSSITVRVPLVFWNAENSYIATDGTNLIPTQAGQLNPFTYDPTSLRGISPLTTNQPADGYWVTNFTSTDSTASAGFVMLYNATTPSTPALPAPAQLAEFTIRDPFLKQLGLTSPADTQVLIDYDVSYVDNAIAPITMEASAVPVQIPTNSYPGQSPNPPTPSFGWTGSALTFTAMQNDIQNFMSNTGSAAVGQYFTNPLSPPPPPGSPLPPGWPAYYTPPAGATNSTAGIKIPGGQNIFLQSPLNGTTSSLDHTRYMLTSGGTEPIQISPGGQVLTTSRPTQIPLTLNPAQRNALASQLQSMLQTGPLNLALSMNPNTTLGQVTNYNPDGKLLGFSIAEGGKGYKSNLKYKLTGGGQAAATGTAQVNLAKSGSITLVKLPNNNGGGGIYTSAPSLTFISGGSGGSGAQVYPDIGGGTAAVSLNNGVTLPTGQGLTYIFSRPVTDYAASDITNLWYTWAQYYINYFKNLNFEGESVKGTLTLQGDLEHLDQAAFIAVNNSDLNGLTIPLAVGMTVTKGPGITPAAGTNVTIVKIQPDATPGVTDFYLSQLPGGSTSGTYTFGPPQALPYSDPTGIENITVTNGGTGYVPPLTVSLDGGNGAGATAVVNGISNDQITSFQITNPGGNYAFAPTVVITGGGGTNASAKATITNGQVTGITIVPGKGGSGYSMGTQVSLTGGGGNDATASAVVNPQTGAVTGIVITNSGHGYSQSPSNPLTVSISGGNGNATATATVGSYVSTYANLLPTDPNTMLQGGTVLQFAGSVYEALDAEASISPTQSLRFYNAVMPPPVGLVGTTIGSDLGDLPNSNGGASVLGGQVRDLIKSVLRGVWNFEAVPESSTLWYPDPSAKPVSTLPFNPFNLDPYVWFIHDVLGMSGYGFSTDDDIANVGAFTSPYASPQSPAAVLPNNLAISFGGTSKLPQSQQWYPGVPWGIVKTTGTVSTSGGKAFVTLAPGGVTPTAQQIIKYYEVIPVTPGQSGGAYVLGPGIPAGTTVNIRNLENNLSFSLNVPSGETVTPSGGTVNLTFTGNPFAPLSPPSPPPFGSSPPPNASPPPNVTLSPSALRSDLVQLVQDEFSLVIDQIFALIDGALMVTDPALETSLAAYTNSVNTNPITPTLFGQLVIYVTRLEALKFLEPLTQ